MKEQLAQQPKYIITASQVEGIISVCNGNMIIYRIIDDVMDTPIRSRPAPQQPDTPKKHCGNCGEMDCLIKTEPDYFSCWKQLRQQHGGEQQ